jgi:hypothetical protein
MVQYKCRKLERHTTNASAAAAAASSSVAAAAGAMVTWRLMSNEL